MVLYKDCYRESAREDLDARGKDIVQNGVILDLGSGLCMVLSWCGNRRHTTGIRQWV